MSESIGEVSMGGDRRLLLCRPNGSEEDVTDIFPYAVDPDIRAFQTAAVLLDFTSMQTGDEVLMEYGATDAERGGAPSKVIFRKEGSKFFGLFASVGEIEEYVEYEIIPRCGLMSGMSGNQIVSEDGPPRIKEGYFLSLLVCDDKAYRSVNIGPFLDPWSESQFRLYGLIA